MEENVRLTQGLGRTLLLWSISSFIAGVLLLANAGALLQGIGLQAVLWGIIDAIIALFTLFKQRDQSIQKMARILKINVGLDVIYQLIGLLLIVFLWADAFILGNGIGVILQGAFLFVLDLYYYRETEKVSSVQANS